MHFKDNRAISGAAYAYELSGGGGAKKIGGGDASGGGRAGGAAGGGGASGGDGSGTGGAGTEVEETLQDAILAEKVGLTTDVETFVVVYVLVVAGTFRPLAPPLCYRSLGHSVIPLSISECWPIASINEAPRRESR